MNVYLHATDVSLTVSLQGIAASAVTYRVLDAAGAELLAETATAFVAGDADISITVPALLNTLATGIYRDIRKVELKVTAADGVRTISELYAVEVADVLVEGVNSYQNYETAELTAMFSQPLDGWALATKEQRVSAMIQARDNIGRLNFSEIGDAYYVNQSRLNVFGVGTGINDLTVTEYAALSAQLRDALKKAQVVEADYLLSSGTIDHKRDQGLMSETIGESSNMFRPGKPLDLSICKRAARMLAGHVTYTAKIGRA